VRHILGQTILRALAQSSVALCVVWVLSAATRTRTDLILSSLRVACAAFAVRWIAIGMRAELSGNPAIARGCYSHALAILLVGFAATVGCLLATVVQVGT
jgi:hypothetical protein